MNIRKKQKKSVVIGILIVALALGAGSLFFYWNNKNIQSDGDNATETSKRTDIDYSPPTEEQKNGGESAKKDLANDYKTTPPGQLSVELSAFKKSNGDVRATANILGLVASEGTCELTVTKDGATKKQQSSIAAVTDYSTCQGFDFTDLDDGTWQIQVNVTSGGKSGSATTAVEV